MKTAIVSSATHDARYEQTPEGRVALLLLPVSKKHSLSHTISQALSKFQLYQWILSYHCLILKSCFSIHSFSKSLRPSPCCKLALRCQPTAKFYHLNRWISVLAGAKNPWAILKVNKVDCGKKVIWSNWIIFAEHPNHHNQCQRDYGHSLNFTSTTNNDRPFPGNPKSLWNTCL